MAKINGNPVDPKKYAARVTNAKKIIAKTDPETKKKIAQMYSKATPTPKPISKNITPKMPGMDPAAKVASKPKPTPKFTMPTIAEYRQSAGYKTDSQSYKDYVYTAKAVYDAKYKKKK